MSYHAGFDYITSRPGEKECIACVACCEPMNKERVTRYVSKYGTPLPKPVIEDVFTCKNSGQGWHTQLIYLLKDQSAFNSHAMYLLLEKEIKQIRKTKQATLAKYKYK